MTTKDSPLPVLQAQADKIAAAIKGFEKGQIIDARFADKMREARGRDSFKVGVVMDDKMITINIRWDTIRGVTQEALAAYVVRLMQEAGTN